MASVSSTSLSTLLNLVGISVADNSCVLSRERLRQLGAQILALYPPDVHTAYLTGGLLADLELPAYPPPRSIQMIHGQADVSFLVIAGPKGGLALLASPAEDHYRTQLISDRKSIDRVVLVLSQYSRDPFAHKALGDAEIQRVFITRLITTLLINPIAQMIDLAALLPTEGRWLDLARVLLNQTDIPSLLTLPTVAQLLRDNGCVRTLLGQLDTNQQLQIIAADSDPAPKILATNTGILIDTLHSKRLMSARPDRSPTEQQAPNSASAWASGDILTALPIIPVAKIWGMLLVTSKRPLSTMACVNLQGLTTLLAHLLPIKMTASLASESIGNTQGYRTTSAEFLLERAINKPPPQINQEPSHQRHQAIASNRALLNHLSDGVIITNTRGNIIECNQVAISQFELADEVLGTSLIEHNTEILAALLSDAVVGECADSYEVELPSGQLARVHIIEAGPDLWAFIIQMPPQFYPVEYLYDQRPAYSSEAALRKAEPSMTELATAPSQQQDHTELPVLLSHKQFFTNLTSFMQMLLTSVRDLTFQIPTAGMLNEQQLHLLGKIAKHNSDLSLIFKDLVAIEHMHQKKIERTALIQIDRLIAATIKTQHAEIDRRGQTLITSMPSNLSPVYGDEERLGRVLSILLDNAIKYSPPGASIQIVALEQEQRIAVSIQNTGVGLPPDEVERVFDLFYRAPSNLHLGIPGRGLGLTIARAIIEGHDGKIWAKSKTGEMNFFAFYLPCVLPNTT
ncbi:MAG: ATP-binding protein [Chloroflexales bacterium]|nr:ATP-binding protein [Chloroflexales bacterium]